MSVTDAPTPPQNWGPFGRRILEWWNTLADAVNLSTTKTAAHTSTALAIGEWATFSPNVGGFTFSSESARYTRVGKLVIVEYKGVISGKDNGGAGTFVTFDLPVDAANAVTGNIVSWGEWSYDDVGAIYLAKPRFSDASSLSARPIQADGLGAGAWRSDGNQPVTPAAGDLLALSIMYEGV